MATEPKITKLKPGEGAGDFKPKQGGKGKGKGRNRGTPGGQTRTQNPCILSDGSVDPACKKVYQRGVAGRQTMQQFISENLGKGSTLKDVANAAVSGLMNRRLGYVGAYLDSNNPSRRYTRPQAVAIVSSVMGKMGYDDIWSGETGKKGDRIKTAGSAGSSVNQQRKQPGGRGGGLGGPLESSPKPQKAPKTDLQQTLEDYKRGKLSKEDLADKLKERLEKGKTSQALPLPGSDTAAKRDEGIARRKEAESAARAEARRARAEERGGQPAAGNAGRGEDESISGVFSNDFEISVLGAAADNAIRGITLNKPQKEWDKDVYDFINEIKDDQIIPEIIQTLIDKKKIDKDQKSIDAAKKYLDWHISKVILGGEEEENNQAPNETRPPAEEETGAPPQPGKTQPPAEEEIGAPPQPGKTQPPAEEETGAPPQPGEEPSPRKFGSQKLRDRAIKAKGEKELEETQKVNELLGRMANSPFAQEDEEKRKFIEDDLLPKLLEEVRKEQPQPEEEPSQPAGRRPPTDQGLGRITNAPGKGGGRGFGGSFTPTPRDIQNIKDQLATASTPQEAVQIAKQGNLFGGKGFETEAPGPLEEGYSPREEEPAGQQPPEAEEQKGFFKKPKGKKETYEPYANLNRVPKAYQSSAKTAPAPQPDETPPSRRPPTDQGLGPITNAPGKSGGGKGFAGSFTPTPKDVKEEPPAPGGKPGQLDLLGGRGYKTGQEDNPLEDKEDKYAKYRGPKVEPRQAAQPPADARQPGAEGQQRLFKQSKGKQEKYEPPANLNRVPKDYQSPAKTSKVQPESGSAAAPRPRPTAKSVENLTRRKTKRPRGNKGAKGFSSAEYGQMSYEEFSQNVRSLMRS